MENSLSACSFGVVSDLDKNKSRYVKGFLDAAVNLDLHIYILNGGWGFR
jgi:hypothetical protein